MKTTQIVVTLCALVGSASANEVQVAVGAGAGASTWEGDPVGHTLSRIGYRFRDLVAIDLGGRYAYGTVDERVITELSLGGTIYGRLGAIRPRLRVAGVHQHEEPYVSVKNDPVGSAVGVGDGIRHRYGGVGELGLDLPFAVTNERATWVIGAYVATSVFSDDERGPRSYVFGGMTLGVDYDL